jgi:hypothetical protein
MEEKEGTILDVATRTLIEDGTEGPVEFINPAQISINKSDGVIYIQISTPNKVVRVIKEIKSN